MPPSYYVGTKEVTVTYAFNGFQDLDPDYIGTLDSPPIGGEGEAANGWLVIAQNQSRQGYFYFVSTTYKYNPNGWSKVWYGGEI